MNAEGRYDTVVCIEVLEHIPDNGLSVFFNSIAEKLNPKGTAIITVPTTVIPLTRKHYRHYTIDLFKKQLSDSSADIVISSYEYVFRRPCWYRIFMWFFENHLFSLEIKPLMRLMWKRIWAKYRFAHHNDGHHLIVCLKHSKRYM